MGTELAPGIVCCASLCGSLGVPHHVTAWEQHRTGGDPVKQSFNIRSLAKDKTMDTKLRIVQCPKCRAYLQEPPPGNPFYECGSCFTTLQAKHATQEDVERRLQQKTLLKRMENEKNTKSVSSEDGYKVFTSESSSEKSNDREEHAHSGEGSPSWSPSRWESPHFGPKPGHSSQQQPQPQQQRQAAEPSEKPQYHSQGGGLRARQDVPQDKVEALGHNLRRLAVEDNDEMQYSNRTSPRSPSSEWANGHGTHHLSMRRSRPEESQHRNDGEGHHSQAHQVQKSVSFNDAASKHSGELSRHSGELGKHSGELNKHSGELSRHPGELGRHSGELGKHSGELGKHSGELDRSPSFSQDVHQGSRVAPSDTEGVEDSIHHLLDDFLSARYDERPHYSKVEGYEVQRDMYAATDVAEYGISSRTSSVGDGDSHHATVAENQSRPLSGELDSYVVLDHRVTRPGSYQRSSSSNRQGQLNTTYNLSSDGHERYHSDGERSAHTHAALKLQQRQASYHVQQPSHAPHQSLAQSPPHYAYNKPPAGQNYHGSHEQSSATKGYPCLPRPDEAPYVHCQHCEQLLGVPANLPLTKKSYQKLRCGACMKISVFLIPTEEHVPASTVSPRGNDFQNAHGPHVSSAPDFVNRHVNHGARADSETGDRGHLPSGGSPRLPPMSRNIPRIPSGSKLSAMTSATNGTSMMGHASVSNGVSNLHPATGTIPARSSSSSHYGEGTSYRRSHSAYGPNGEHIMSSLGPRSSAGSDYEGHHPHDGKLFQTSSESDNDSPRMRPPMSSFKGEQFHASSRMPLDRHVAQQYSKDEGYMQEANTASSMSLKGIIKKGVKELSKTKQTSNNNLYRRKVTVNGSPISDALLNRAEGFAGPIHPGSYWYDSHAGFWGTSGGPCVGIIPPHIEELSLQPLSRHCSGGQTGVVVNGRELHKSDYDLLVRRGLPPTPGKQYFVDIEGHVTEAVSGYELRGLGPLAPTLDQTSRGHGMWIPGSSQVA
ncbi:hypothetical protein KC19_5G164600 [Ceratodon purpureus]|uniref:Zinc-ribbon domain-containing protein n=1 Tax=Ceratodon purpureus TaxID=3225 RepID=A0A8T0I277_CERPU|nr:hypothetical protein KC19_5G164600 [Ceratodon purpureus]